MISCLKTLLIAAGILALIKRTHSIQTYNVNCLGQDADIDNALTSTRPPFDNYYNVSRALYPSAVSSLYIRIHVKFVSDSGVQIRLYTWAMSCLYVATEYVSLFAINLYSLGAILPNRRQAELYITLPELCNNLTDDKNGSDSKMLYFLSTLEDVAMKPNVLEPQLNNVECVVKGHSDFTKKIFTGVNYHMLMNICWCAWLISLVTAFVSSLLITTWLNLKDLDNPKDSKCKKKAAMFLFSVLFVLQLVITCVAVSEVSSNSYSIVFLVSVIILPLPFIFIYAKKENINIKSNIKEFLINCLTLFVVFDSLFMTSHSLIWILLGVITEPFWAMPVLVVACSLCFSVYVLVFHYCKAFSKHDSLALGLSVALILVLLLFFFITGVVSHSFLSNSLVAGLIQSALVIVASVSLNFIAEPSSNDAGRDTRDGEGPRPIGDLKPADLCGGTTETAPTEEMPLNVLPSERQCVEL